MPYTRSSQNVSSPAPTNIRCIRLGVTCEPQKRGRTTAPFRSLASAIANFPQSSFSYHSYHNPSLPGLLHSDPPSRARSTFNQALRGHQHPQSHSQSLEPRVFTAHAKPARHPRHEAATDPCRQQLPRYNQLALPPDVAHTLSSSSSSSSSLPSFLSSSSSSLSSSFPSSSFPSSTLPSSSSSLSSFSDPMAPVHKRLVTDSFLAPCPPPSSAYQQYQLQQLLLASHHLKQIQQQQQQQHQKVVEALAVMHNGYVRDQATLTKTTTTT
ncbi:Hypothetical protein NocV09_02200080 [Nannochloropsis oceanica]